MNETNLDQLLRVTSPTSNWGSPAYLNGRDDQPVFDDHLALASSPRVAPEPARAAETRPPESKAPVGPRPAESETPHPKPEDNTSATPATAPDECGTDDEQSSSNNRDNKPENSKPTSHTATNASTGNQPEKDKTHDEKSAGESDKKGNDKSGRKRSNVLAKMHNRPRQDHPEINLK